MARRFHGTRGRGPRRETDWIALSPLVDTLDGSGTVLVSTANAALQALAPYTIVRTHLYWSFQSDQVIASEFFACAIGMAVVSSQSAAVGVGSIPTPLTDLGSDKWLLWDFMTGAFNFQSAVGVDAQFESNHYRIDSKAMRKVEDGEASVLVLEAPAFSSGMTVTTAGRQLIKLH